MGIGYQAAQLLCEYYSDKNNLPNNAKSIMLGRHNIERLMPQKQKNAICSSYQNINKKNLSGYADNFIKEIGFAQVDSLDLTNFEGANKLFNLSIPLSSQNANDIKNKYDAVFDFGTSEHVFSIATSIKNSLYMLKKNGALIMSIPMTGFADHGFFQVSPCFYYALNNNIFELDRLYFYNHSNKTSKVLAFDALHEDFKKHLDGTYDGSFLANVLSHSGKKFSSFAVLRKKSEDTLDDSDVIQPVYRAMTQGNLTDDYIADSGYKHTFKLRVFKFLHKKIPEAIFSKIVLLTYKKSRLILSKH